MSDPSGQSSDAVSGPIVAAAAIVERAEHAIDPRPSAERLPPAATVSPETALRRGQRASWIGVAGIAGFATVLAYVRSGRSHEFDQDVMHTLQRAQSPLVRGWMRAASWPGFPPQSRLITPIAISGLWVARLRLESLALLAGWGTALVSTLAKSLTVRARPAAGGRLQVVSGRLGGTSFPSGHVLTYMGTYGLLAYFAHTLIRHVPVRRFVVGGLVGLLASVGPSRVHRGHHWPTDVIASYLLGTSYLVALTSVYRRIKARRAGIDR